MPYLIDTHVLIWQLNEPEKLSDTVRNIIIHSNDDMVVSVASLWEIAIKAGLGRLELKISFSEMQTVLENYNIRILNIHLAHLEQYRSLSFIHKDPFDRILIAQALSDNLVILTKDQAIQQYPIKAIW